jgi:DNA-binding MurR/RpiR family transcriptional regulator
MRHDLRGTDASDRRTGILARADAVRDGVALLAGAAWTDTATMAGLAPDQVWVVVDVGRKHEDTVAVLQAVVEAGAPVVGVVAIGADETATPGTVHLLGVPVMSL